MRAAILLCLGLVACRPLVSNDPTVYLDADFGSVDGTAVSAIDTWRRAGVDPHFVIVDHAELTASANRHEDGNGVYVVRVHGMGACPVTVMPGNPANTSVEGNGAAVTCVDLDEIEKHVTGDEIRRAFAHEFGHALGLHHTTDSDALMLNAYSGASAPACVDFLNLTQVRGSTVPDGC